MFVYAINYLYCNVLGTALSYAYFIVYEILNFPSRNIRYTFSHFH